ncbi:MAG TPA: NHLP bacteriocin export ABC transporter permease/ATPase subunit [Bacteroidales bacterium]|nr:NHLP bacteriocin export ABC transporter permease/ATPase subunit [Bacteroidales bacterium]HRZ21244.1 NHLP bacteriocin export ABC transporter permease/ATPase subunit [Bacteroidales bacterium]
MSKTEIPLEQIFKLEGQLELSGSNHPIYLNDPGQAWFIASGKVDVFSIRMEKGQPAGARFYFFTVNAGEMMLGLDSDRYGNEKALLAVGSAGAIILRLELPRLMECTKKVSHKEEVAHLMDGWVQGLLFGVSKNINPETLLLLEPDIQTRIPDHTKFGSRKGVCWIRMLTGNGLILGMSEINEKYSSNLIPLTRDSWIQTIEESTVSTFTTIKALEEGSFWSDLDHFYEMIFFCEFLNTRLELVDEINRLAEKSAELDSRKEHALYRIASVINNIIDSTFHDTGQTPLITACQHIARYSGISLKIPEISDKEKLQALTVKDIARSSHFMVRQVALPEKWWSRDCGPLLAHTIDGNQPVALLPSAGNRYIAFNPEIPGQIDVSREFADTLRPSTYQFYRPFPHKAIHWHDLLKFSLKGIRTDFYTVLGAAVAGGFCTLLLPVLSGVIFDKLIPRSNYQELVLFAFALFTGALAIALFQLVKSFALIRMETRIDFQVQAALWDRILAMPASFFKKYSSGELASKANSVTVLRKMLSNTVIHAIVTSIFGIFNYFLLFAYDPLLAILTSVLLLLSLAMFGYYGIKIQRQQRLIIQLQNQISGLLIQFLSSISKIKIAGAEIPAFALWADRFSQFKRSAIKVKIYSNILQVFMSVLPVIVSMVVFGIIAGDKDRSLSTGEFMAFFTALTVTVAIILQMGMSGIALFTSLPLFENIRPILETLPENVNVKHEILALRGEVEINHINFRYEPDGPLVLRDLSMHVLPGEYVAIVGPSGSGKSTLLRLLLGLEIPENGAIYYDRQDLSNIDPSSVRRQIGSVLQDTRLAPGNIFSNIIGVSNATMDEAWEAARMVGLDEDIRQMPMGMFTIVSDGLSTLSGGQRQRILLARAIVANPRILFLDEATSALDNETQRTVSGSLENIQATRLVIAHRLSTIRNADKIYVVDNGQVMETGTFDQLMNNAGHFADLVKRQLID